MENNSTFDVIIIGGSYSGLAAAMALGRAMRTVLVIDAGLPCNQQTPHSHNFLTHDGKPPKELAALARQQVSEYGTVQFFRGSAKKGSKTANGFEIRTSTGEAFYSIKLIFATGIRDLLPNIVGLAECWGISVLHCPYCHGYEVRNQTTGILGQGDTGFELAMLISNWSGDLWFFTNGKPTLSPVLQQKLESHNIRIINTQIERFEHLNGYLQNIILNDGTSIPLKALYAQVPFEQHSRIPETLGCELTDMGYIKTDPVQKTSISGIFACGDCTTRLRTLANAVATGTTAGMMVNKDLVMEAF